MSASILLWIAFFLNLCGFIAALIGIIHVSRAIRRIKYDLIAARNALDQFNKAFRVKTKERI